MTTVRRVNLPKDFDLLGQRLALTIVSCNRSTYDVKQDNASEKSKWNSQTNRDTFADSEIWGRLIGVFYLFVKDVDRHQTRFYPE